MVLTRSNYDTERNKSTARTSFNDGETTQMNGRNGETGDTNTPAASTIVPATGHRSADIMTSTVTATLTPARSRRSNTSNKKLIAELEVKERLAKLELQRIQAAAELENIRLKRIAAESSESETEEEDLASRRIADWLNRRSGQNKEVHPISEERRELAANTDKKHKRQENEETPRPIHSMDVTSLTAALAAAIEASKSNKNLIPNLPTFSGSSQEWLHYKFAFLESAPSFSPSENVARIRMSLKGVALDAVSALLISRPQPEDIISALERRFGRSDALLRGEIEKIKNFPRLTGEPNDLCTFATRIANAVATIQLLEKPHYLYSTELSFAIVEKLTPILRNKWYDYAATTEDAPELKKIAAFLNIEADKCAAYAPPEKTSENRENIVTKKRPERTYTVTKDAKKNTKEKLCEICKESHQLSACPRFNEADVNTRWEMAKKSRVCYRCLMKNHRRFACRAKPCGHNGCHMRHHHLLHHERTPPTAVAASSDPQTSTNAITVASATQQVAAAANISTRAYLKIVPVTLRGPQTAVDTFALLDEGSTVTIIDASLADSIGLDGPIETMWIQDVSGKEMAHKKSKIVNIAIKGKYNREELQIFNARTVASLDFTTQSISEKDIKDCEHLADIKSELLYNNATPKILIGQDNWEIIVSREIKGGRRDQLVASRTALGWVLHGCRKSQAEPIRNVCAQLTLAEPIDRMEDMMKEYFALESLSIEPRKPKSDPELRALNILEEKSRRLSDGRYETGLLWRDENENMPSNRMDALKRLRTLERKLDRNEDLKRQYNERIDNYLKSNYAERANAPPCGRTWYLPHFAVCNPEKPKIRVVHDAAAKSQGRSLNDMLLPGPDLLQSLPGVIMRFRQYSIGVSSDIKEMFMQIKIREEDRDALRFLWRGDRREGDPEEYRMSSVIFGASSSPCTALYIKNKNAQEYASEYPHAARAIERNHYMDDYLQSFTTIEEAKQVTKDVDYIHKQAGFQLRGWATNVKEAIKGVAGSEREKTAVPIGGSEMEKTLGLLWDTREDCIRFRLNTKRAPPEVLRDLRPPTKREALSIIMSIFDPLGLISPITMPAKRIMQDTWHYNISWDEEIPGELHNRWSDWLRQLNKIGDLSIQRCYNKEPAARYELHTFVDASEEAYAAAVYWRMIRADGSINVALAAAKSRVTPTKPISIPRLELQAAVLGTRLTKSVAAEHDYVIATKTYWSDSRTVLAWIRAEPRTYKTFVAHRLAEIEEASKRNEWRWLPSADNVADDATRATPTSFGAGHRWYKGPSFLYESDKSWPTENKIEIPVTGEEKERCNVLQLPSKQHAHLPKVERFSKWTRLLRATGRVLQFIDLCRRTKNKSVPLVTQFIATTRKKRTRANPDKDGEWNKKTPPIHLSAKGTAARNKPKEKYIILQARYINEAEQLWIRASQEDIYGKEIARITNDRRPDKDDRLAKLSVYIDENRVLRLRGRIEAADNLHKEAMYPAVLYGKHYYTRLYVSHIHEKLHHGGTEIVVNELRQRVHIIKIRPTVKVVIANCLQCQLRKAKPPVPSTGDLPAARLAHHMRPFSHTGLDYYGPLEVTVGRHREKRYVALFTCMTSRAIHLEVAASLSTDSAINALRRFIARRGCPTELWSDNATTFRGANRELTEAIKNFMSARRINWRFLPPAAPFMAGAWERMVRTVKEAMRATLHEKYPSDETLTTLLAEVEATVNSRPLTYVAVDPDDPPALTPNMILIGPDCHSPAPGTFVEQDNVARKHWRRAQQLADTFWKRWVREYVPLLQQRREPHNIGVTPAIGDLVIICDPNLPRNTWPRGKISKIYPGKDGIVRVVDVTTSRGHVLKRPTKKIVVLPV